MHFLARNEGNSWVMGWCNDLMGGKFDLEGVYTMSVKLPDRWMQDRVSAASMNQSKITLPGRGAANGNLFGRVQMP